MMSKPRQVSCAVCLHRQNLIFDRIAIHLADITGEGAQQCPGSSEPPLIAADLQKGDIFQTETSAFPWAIGQLLPFESAAGAFMSVEAGGVTLTLPADEPVIVIDRTFDAEVG